MKLPRKCDLSRLKIADIQRYLLSRGWGECSGWTDRATFFEKGGYTVLVPLSQNYRDYKIRISEAIQILVRVENQYAYEIIREIRGDDKTDYFVYDVKGQLVKMAYSLSEVEKEVVALKKSGCNHIWVEESRPLSWEVFRENI